ncbi:MAG: efflux RND transporter permease subunit [Candidatus Woykebacteria bacterium]
MEDAEKSFLAKFSLWFLKNGRVTFLLFISLLAVGYVSYTKLLTREGFPAVQVPIVFIQTPYFVVDVEKVDREITSPIEKSIADLQEVKEINSTTTENISFVIVEFDQDFSTEQGAKILRDEVEKSAVLPKGVEPEYNTVNAGSIDGEHDLLFTISGDKSIQELQTKAEEIANKLEEVSEVATGDVVNLVTKETNPVTGEEFDYQSSFDRIGLKKGNKLEFSPAISIGVVKKGDPGTLKLSDAVRNKIDEIKKDGGLDGYDISYGGDFAESLRSDIDDLENNAFTGLLAVIVILYFLISWRASVVAALFIPTVMTSVFVGLFLLGYTLNVITLFSLILVLGLIVDDAVVVVEAIDYQKRNGAKGIKAIASAIRDIAPADIAGTLTTVLVFVPMLFVSGLLGEFIQLIPITVILALILSILIGLSITPFLSNIFITDKKTGGYKLGMSKAADLTFNFVLYGPSKFVSYLGDLAGRFIRLYLRQWFLAILVLITTIVWVGVGLSYSQKLTFAVFAPPKNSEVLNIFLTYPEGIEISEAEAIAKDAEEIVISSIEEHVEVINYFEASKTSAFLYVELTPIRDRETTSVEMVKKLVREFENFGETRVRVEQGGVGPPIDEFQINLQVFSGDQETLETATKDVEDFLTNREIKNDTYTEIVADVLVGDLNVVSKVDSKRFASIKAKISDPNNTGAILQLQDDIENEYDTEKLNSLGLSEDAVGFDLGQEGENLQSFESTIVALGIALILMYVLLVFQFNSFSQPLLIFLAIPFTIPALFPGLYFTDNALSFFVMIGVIALSGIVVNNSIFLVDYANKERREGKGVAESIAQAVSIRFRPIIATSLTTIVALLPLTLANPFWESLGLTIIFGLASSSLLIILAFPAFYAVVEAARGARSKFWHRLTNR